ncbi:diguanylate cyclase [Serratia marcescens]|uniref:diguanylate cyclase domain-containing protein n=1 Tax=Serratia marcescens TaxID=615 RepID=UPI002E7B1DE8|nr:diguanylate cyclase [Serratia marcescens]WVJ40829.1 diguanylate cyclase [Serratia marcescens]
MEISAPNTFGTHKGVMLTHSLLVALATFLLALLSLSLSSEARHFTPLWFPTAAAIAVLYRHAPRHWGLPLLASGLGIVLASFLLFGVSATPVKLAAINLLEAAVCALLLRRTLPANDPLSDLGCWLRFVVCAVIFTPLFSALLAAGLSPTPDQTFWQSFGIWFISEAIGVLSLAPLGLTYHRRTLAALNPYPLLLTLMGSLAFSYLALTYLPFPFTFVILPLLWAAIALPRFEAFAVCFCTLLLITVLISLGVLHLQASAHVFGELGLYLPMLLILIPAHAMAMVMHTFRVEKQHIVESESRFRSALEYSAIGMALVSPEGKWLQVNQALCKLLGYTPEGLHRLTFQAITHPDDLNADLSQLHDLLDGHISSYTMEKRYIRSDGQTVWALLAVSLVRDAEEQPLYFISQVEDISGLKRSEAENNRLVERITLANQVGGVGIWEWVMSQENFTWDQRMFELYDLNPDQTPTLALWRTLLVPEDRERTDRELAALLAAPKPFVMEFRITTRGGKLRHIRGQGNVILDDQGQPLRMIGTNIDMTELKILAEALTGLPNRTRFEKQLKAAIAAGGEPSSSHSLVFLDLDRFKAVNDTAGHAAGDALLRDIAQLMRHQLRNSDCLARLGGDEFGLILFDCRLEQAKSLMQQVVNQISQHPFYWEGKIYRVGASAGITRIGGDAKSSELLAQADIACYTAKHHGRGQVYLYETRQKQMLERQHELLNPQEVQTIISEGQLRLLTRAVAPPATPLSAAFHHVKLQVMAPDDRPLPHEAFIAAAQLYGLMPDIDRWAVTQLLVSYADDIKRKGLSLALPLATDSLLNTDFQRFLTETVRASSLPPRALLFSVDEAVVLEHAAQCRACLRELQQLGCRLIVNGFGHNINAFDELGDQKIDIIRIDERFITNLHCNQMDELMVSMLNGAAHRIKAQTLAGPAHQPVTLQALRDVGVDLADGDQVALEQPLAVLLSDGYFGIR